MLVLAEEKKRRSNLKNDLLLLLSIPFLIIWVPIVIFVFVANRLALHLLVRLLWLPRGKNVLVVYSDSPIWHEYMTKEILPVVAERAVTLNWSERKKWSKRSLAVSIFYSFAGDREFNPLVIVFRLLRPALILRFWPAFKDRKYGRTESVERLREKLLLAL